MPRIPAQELERLKAWQEHEPVVANALGASLADAPGVGSAPRIGMPVSRHAVSMK